MYKRQPLSHQAVYSIINRISEFAGVEKGVISPHSFRHYVATKLAGINVSLAQEQLGHKSPATTGRYIHFTQNDLSRVHKEIFA